MLQLLQGCDYNNTAFVVVLMVTGFIFLCITPPEFTAQLVSDLAHLITQGIALLLVVLYSIMTPWWMFGDNECSPFACLKLQHNGNQSWELPTISKEASTTTNEETSTTTNEETSP